MGGVLAPVTARQDVLIYRNADTRWAVCWTNSLDGGLTYQPVNLLGDSGTVQLLSPSGEVWMTRSIVGTVEGYGVVELTPANFSDPVWQTRQTGYWIMTISHEGREERLGEGYFFLED